MKRTLLNPSFRIAQKSWNVLSKVAGIVGVLSFFSINFSTNTGYAALDPTLSEPLIKLGTLPPEEEDGPFQSWKERHKYFLVIAVNETGLPNTDLPFTKADATEIATALTGLGYQPLDSDHPILTGKEATRSAIIKAVKTSHQGKNDNDMVAIYFTGHGSVGTEDLWLQTYGQEELGEGQGIALSELVKRTRFKEGQSAFEGELVIIVDTCFSGQGVLSHSLTMGELGRKTTIFSASTKKQESYPLQGPDLPSMSAFTYSLLQAMGPQWTEADWDGDGMLRYGEIQIFSKNLLKQLHETGHVKALMEPELFNADQAGFLAYQRNQIRNWKTPYRTALQKNETSRAFAANLQTLGANPKEKPEVPQAAKALAKGLTPEPEDFQGQALQATAEGRMQDARALFVKADQQSQTREQAEETRRQEALTQQQEAEAAKEAERDTRYEIYLARARMETYDGKFTEAFKWYQKTGEIRPTTALDLINEIGVAGLRAGKYPEAEPYLQQALEQRERTLDPQHPELALSLNNLAVLYHAQGKYAEAELLAQRALHITEAVLVPTHPDLAVSLNNLAVLYHAQGKYAEAEPLAQRALWIKETAFGLNHPSVATSLNTLAELYCKQRKYAEAESLFQRAITIFESALVVDHPDVATTLTNLAGLYKAQGKYAEAESLFQRAIKISKTALGENHPDLGTSLNGLAMLYNAQGKFDEAETLYHQTLVIYEMAFGPNHPWVATALNNQAVLYYAQGKYAQGEPLAQRALQIDESAFGPNHPDVARDLKNLAEFYFTQWKYAEAEPLAQRALRIREEVLGPNHPDVGYSLNTLAGIYRNQEEYAEAEPLYQRALRIIEAALGPDHTSVAVCVTQLALLYKNQGKYTEAEPLYQRALRIDEGALGPNHPDVASDLNSLAGLYKAQGKYAQGEPLAQRALRIDEAAFGPNHPDVAHDLNTLAELYRKQRKYAEAEPLYERAIKIAETVLSPNHPTLAMYLDNRADLYADQGQFDQAAHFYQRSYWIFSSQLGPNSSQAKKIFSHYQEFLKISGQAHDGPTVHHKLQQAIESIEAHSSQTSSP